MRRYYQRINQNQFLRYFLTSVFSFVLSETTLLLLYASSTLDATRAALCANVAGLIPAYLLSRYWVWRHANRSQVARQVLLYWIVSAATIALTSLFTGELARLAPPHHSYHIVVVATGFPAVTLIFWLIKYAIYQHFVFPSHPSSLHRQINNGPPEGRPLL